MTDPKQERTFIAVKPDGVQRGLIGEIIKRFEARGYKMVAGKLIWAPKDLLKNHYKDLADKPFYNGLVEYMSSGPVFAMVWEGKEVVKMGRQMLGATNPLASMPGTIRGDFGIDVGRNICHGSDAVETARREIALWFKEEELSDYEFANKSWIYE
ncbi:nucleoside diphosphate kinase [Biomphalaria glabrata]|nr:nucleoside diphosphate kinase-like [Biomphalaria glabrata]KAI8797880.1 nucleoside diphosphate kinase [Biomphalaria glabrata]KAK0059516.1 nucleoside diphosphate kinase [Biomphalaria pfeifferi]